MADERIAFRETVETKTTWQMNLEQKKETLERTLKQKEEINSKQTMQPFDEAFLR